MTKGTVYLYYIEAMNKLSSVRERASGYVSSKEVAQGLMTIMMKVKPSKRFWLRPTIKKVKASDIVTNWHDK